MFTKMCNVFTGCFQYIKNAVMNTIDRVKKFCDSPSEVIKDFVANVKSKFTDNPSASSDLLTDIGLLLIVVAVIALFFSGTLFIVIFGLAMITLFLSNFDALAQSNIDKQTREAEEAAAREAEEAAAKA